MTLFAAAANCIKVLTKTFKTDYIKTPCGFDQKNRK